MMRERLYFFSAPLSASPFELPKIPVD